MRAFLLTYHSRDSFLAALKDLSLQGEWHVETVTSHDDPAIDTLRKNPRHEKIYRQLATTFGLGGGAAGFAMQWYSAVIDTPLNIGGRPLDSWPAFLPITFICSVLSAALAIFVGFLWNLRFPWPSHPLFTTSSYGLSKNLLQILLTSSQSQVRLDPRKLRADFVEEISWSGEGESS